MSRSSDWADAFRYTMTIFRGYTPYKVFYAGGHYGNFDKPPGRPWSMPRDLPDGAYIYDPDRDAGNQWYRSDFTPVLDQDVPPELKMWVLVLN